MRIFFYGEQIPAELEFMLRGRDLCFEAAYLSGYERVFRSSNGRAGLATLIPKEKMIVFGFLMHVRSSAIDDVDRFMGVPKGQRTRRCLMVGHGDGDLSPTEVYFLTRDKAFREPERESLMKIAEWTTRFWPKTDDERTRWTEIPVR